MRKKSIWTILIGLLYVAAVTYLGISPYWPTVNIQLEPTAILQGITKEPEATPEPTATPEPEISFSAGTFPVSTRELTLVLEPEELALLEEFGDLQLLDATGSECIEELDAWGQEHPQVDLRFTVPMPLGEPVSNQTESLDLTGLSSDLLPEAEQQLAFLHQLKTLELGSPDEGTTLSASELEQLRANFPQVTVQYRATLLGQELDPELESLDLTELKPEDAEKAAAALSALPNLKQLTLAGGENGLSLEQALLVARAAPNAVVSYPGVIYGKRFNLADTGLDLNHIEVPDKGETVRAVLPCMRACTWLDMDSCGVDNQHMAVIRDENPSVEVIWRVWFGTNYSVRTNVTKILASNPSKGGILTDKDSNQLMYCTKVRYLDLGHNPNLADFSFIRYMPDLEVAVISMTAISDISPFAECAHLRYLEAGNTKLTDISPLAACTELRHLNIGTNIGITDISGIYDLELKRLWIGSYTPVPKAQAEQMRSLHPDCIVNTTVPSGIGGANEGYVMEGWKSYQNYLTADWSFYASHHYFPAQRPIGWYKVVYKCFEYNLTDGAYAFLWNDPLYGPHEDGVKPVNVKVIDTSFLMEDWVDPGSIIPDVLSDPPGETLYEGKH